MLNQYQLRDYKFKLILWVMCLSGIGILIVGSAKESIQDKQILGVVLGLIVMVIISIMDYSYVLNFYWFIYFLNIILLVLVKVMGKEVGGAARWITIAGIQFQPSEMSKILLILFFAKFFGKYKEEINTVKILGIACVLFVIPLYLIESQPDLSTSIVVALIFCALLYISGLSYKIIGGVLAVVVPAAAIFISLVLQPGQKLINTYQANRILAWLQPSKYKDLAYQQTNSVIAIGSGQLFGKGLNNNTVASVKNGNFISEPQTDFIFAIVGEEMGFVGCCIVIILIALIVFECIRIGKNSKDLSGRLICCGVASWIAFQSFVNIGVATFLLPNTGLPLPFVSAGLTSLVSSFIGIGFVLNVGLQPKKY